MNVQTKQRVSLRRPADFTAIAMDKGADVSTGHGSRVVVRYHGRTIGFSDRGNKEYSRQYRHLLIRAFSAAGLLGLLLFMARFALG